MENQRHENIAYIESIKGDLKERHELEWENFRFKNEIKQLKLDLSENKLNYFDEKS